MAEQNGNVGLVVDSVADLPQKYIEELGNIKIVPFHVYFNNEEKFYTEGVNLSNKQFYQMLTQPNIGMPKTQGPSQGQYLEAFNELLNRFSHVITLNMSSRMSVAFNSANLARQMLPEADIRQVDTETVSMVLGLYALQAARAAKAGATVEEILKKVEYYKQNTVQLFVTSTLKYLKQSGRVNQALYLIGSALQIKPILTFKEGLGTLAGREISQERAFIRIAKAIGEKFGDKPVLVSVVHSEAPEQAEQLKERILQRANVKELIIAEIGPTLGAHGGPGMTGATAIPAD